MAAPTLSDVDVGKMALYGLDRARNAIASISSSGKPVWELEDTSSFDCMHYLGNSAIDNAAAELGLQPGQVVIDLGAGFGATGRYLAKRYGASVVGVELQKDIHDLAETITASCGKDMASKVRSVNGDFLVLPMAAEPGASEAKLPCPVNHIVSMLCILHIPARAQLFRRAFEILAPGGRMYIEDFVAAGPLDGETTRVLRDIVSCPYLPDRTQYEKDLKEAGFELLKWEDMRDSWGPFVHHRAVEYRKGAEVEENLAAFYDAADWLFNSGKISGCRITAKKAET